MTELRFIHHTGDRYTIILPNTQDSNAELLPQPTHIVAASVQDADLEFQPEGFQLEGVIEGEDADRFRWSLFWWMYAEQIIPQLTAIAQRRIDEVYGLWDYLLLFSGEDAGS